MQKKRKKESKKRKTRANKFLHLFLIYKISDRSTVFHKTRFFRTKILDDEEEQSDKSLCKKKKRKREENNRICCNHPNANSSRRYIIIKSDIWDNFEVKPFRAIILSRWYLHALSRPVREISMESCNREREREREHGKYTWVKSLFAPGPPSPQAFQLLLTINVRWKGRGCAFKALVHRRGIFAGNDSAVPPERVLMRSPLFAFQERIVKMIRLDPPPG